MTHLSSPVVFVSCMQNPARDQRRFPDLLITVKGDLSNCHIPSFLGIVCTLIQLRGPWDDLSSPSGYPPACR